MIFAIDFEGRRFVSWTISRVVSFYSKQWDTSFLEIEIISKFKVDCFIGSI